MPDTGIWKLKCSQCEHEFEIEITASQSIVETSKSCPCPRCFLSPSAAPIDLKLKERFHRIVGFSASRKPS
jgi:hypothetical protein